jgi:hypothetical protein
MALHKKRVAAVAGILIAAVVLLGFAALGVKSLINGGSEGEIAALKRRVAALEEQINAAGASNAAPSTTDANQGASTALDEAAYEGWPTYTNASTGYTLRYPPDWTFQENSSELNGRPLEYVAFVSPDNQYYVAFGFRLKNSDTLITPRTGTGPGDMKAAGTINVLGTKVKRTEHIYKGRLKDVFYPSVGGVFNIGAYQGYAEFTRMTPENYEDYNLADASETDLADKLVSSLQSTQQQ